MSVRVLIVDDSVTVRAVLRRVLEAASGIEVVGEAADGARAVELTVSLGPDAVVMDLDLPVMDGCAATEQIMARQPTPVVVVTSKVQRDQMGPAFDVMKHGAVAVFAKPSIPDQWADLGEHLPETLRHVARRQATRPSAAPAAEVDTLPRRLRYLLIGASTGGPGAVRLVLHELMPRLRLGVVVVQHISAGFETGLADWLAGELDADVGIARDGQVLGPGQVRIAPAGSHLRLTPGGVLSLDNETAPIAGHRPAVEVLFRSAVGLIPREVAAVLLTGMGSDGANGMLALRRAGALTVGQDENSCAVFGMPRVAFDLGATDTLLAPAEIGRLLARAQVEESS